MRRKQAPSSGDSHILSQAHRSSDDKGSARPPTPQSGARGKEMCYWAATRARRPKDQFVTNRKGSSGNQWACRGDQGALHTLFASPPHPRSKLTTARTQRNPGSWASSQPGESLSRPVSSLEVGAVSRQPQAPGFEGTCVAVCVEFGSVNVCACDCVSDCEHAGSVCERVVCDSVLSVLV